MSQEHARRSPLRERLVLAGIEEINTYGIQSFSMRRVAAACNVSCATPYKHFADREDFFAAIIEYINKTWAQVQAEIVAAFPGDLRLQLVQISGAYIKFLLDNPQFRSIIMMKDENFDTKYSDLRGRMSKCTREILAQYCPQVGMPPEVELRKTFLVRSLIYGAALMFDNGELPYTEENYSMVLSMINREFDLP